MLPEKAFKFLRRTNYLRSILRFKSDELKGRTALFFEPKIQQLLQKLSSADLETAFPAVKTGEKLEPPEYKFMTDNELKKALDDARARSVHWMQMPPVMDPIEDTVKIIVKDEALDGHDPDGSAYVFTDITFGLKEQERLVLVREPDGTLKHANWDQRQRMAETYVPRPGRELTAPAMFFGEELESLLDRREYKFVLDRACAQFEPNDPEYIRVTSTTYSRVAREKDFRHLHGTRHFGPLVFYLVFNKQVDTLLLENFQHDKLDDAISLVHLFHMIHPDSRSANVSAEGIELLKAFIQQDAGRRSVLEIALQASLERIEEKKAQSHVVEKAHGLN